MKKGKWKIFAVLAVIILAAVYYYVALPAINIHAAGFWTFLAFAVIAILVIYAFPRVRSA